MDAPPAPIAKETVLDERAVDDDLDRARYALEHGYGGFGFVPPEAWAEMDHSLASLRDKKATSADLCDRIADALWSLPDAHLSARRPIDGGQEKCGTRARAAKRTASVGPSLLADEDRPWAVDVVSVGHATFGILTIHHFPPKEDPAWAHFDESARSLLDVDGYVVDLRGNDGGDDARGFELASILVDAPVHGGELRTHRRNTPEAITLVLNTTEASARQNDGSFAPFLLDRIHALEADRDLAARTGGQDWKVEEVPQVVAPPGPNAFQGPVAILVDAACASSCESTLEGLRQNPRAKVFGERTAGYIHFGNVGTMVLPKSGIILRVPTKFDEYPGGKLYDKVGFEPDVAVSGGHDALDAGMTWEMSKTGGAKIETPNRWTMPLDARHGEEERLAGLGLKVPSGGPILEHPFAAPFTRRSFVVPPRWLTRHTARRVYAPALLADLDALEGVVRIAYGGFDSAKDHGFDWEAWFTSFRTRLTKAGDAWLPTKVAFDSIGDLESAQLDNHTTIPLGVLFGGASRTWVLSEVAQVPCVAVRDVAGHETPISLKDRGEMIKDARRFDGKELAQGQYIVRPSNAVDPKEVHCGDHWIAVHRAGEPDEPTARKNELELSGAETDRPTLRHLRDDLVYLRLPTFSKANGEIVTRERASWEKPTHVEKAMLVDLRGNDGGDAAFHALDGWIPAKDLEAAKPFNRRKGTSCLYPALRFEYAAFSSLGIKTPTDTLRTGLQSGLDDLFTPDDPACPATFVDETGTRVYRDRRPRASRPKGTPQFFVVVDDGCGSDCELMASTLEKLYDTMVIGVNTLRRSASSTTWLFGATEHAIALPHRARHIRHLRRRALVRRPRARRRRALGRRGCVEQERPPRARRSADGRQVGCSRAFARTAGSFGDRDQGRDGRCHGAALPQHFLYFFADPQRHRSLRPGMRGAVRAMVSGDRRGAFFRAAPAFLRFFEGRPNACEQRRVERCPRFVFERSGERVVLGRVVHAVVVRHRTEPVPGPARWRCRRGTHTCRRRAPCRPSNRRRRDPPRRPMHRRTPSPRPRCAEPGSAPPSPMSHRQAHRRELPKGCRSSPSTCRRARRGRLRARRTQEAFGRCKARRARESHETTDHFEPARCCTSCRPSARRAVDSPSHAWRRRSGTSPPRLVFAPRH